MILHLGFCVRISNANTAYMVSQGGRMDHNEYKDHEGDAGLTGGSYAEHFFSKQDASTEIIITKTAPT